MALVQTLKNPSQMVSQAMPKKRSRLARETEVKLTFTCVYQLAVVKRGQS